MNEGGKETSRETAKLLDFEGLLPDITTLRS